MFSKIKAIKDLKDQATQIKKTLSAEKVEGSGGWGKVKMTMDGNQEVLNVEISPEIINDKAKLETGVKEAANDAIKKAQRVMASKMQEMGGLNIPGLK